MSLGSRFMPLAKLLVGPGCLVVVALLCPRSTFEGPAGERRSQISPVVAEALGFFFPVATAPSVARREPFWFSPSLESASSVVLFPPSRRGEAWSVVPARPGVELTLDHGSQGTSRASGVEPRSSFRPWESQWFARRRRELVLGSGQVRIKAVPADVLAARAAPGTTFSKRWVLQVETARDPARFYSIGSELQLLPGVWLWSQGTDLEDVMLGVAAIPDSGELCSSGQECRRPPEVMILEAGSSEPIARLSPLELRSGDTLEIGSRPFLVRTSLHRQLGREGISLLDARSPDSFSFFPASSGAELYHPGRVETIPPCSGGNPLHVLIPRLGPEAEASPGGFQADAPIRDAMHLRDFEQASLAWVAGPGRLRQGAGAASEIVTCSEGNENAGWRVRFERRGTGDEPINVCSGPSCARLTGAATLPVGTEGSPREALLAADRLLLRVAPAAGRRVQRQTGLALLVFLSAVLVLQALPLRKARETERIGLEDSQRFADELAWPAAAGPATLLQVSGIAIACLLSIGARYQMLLGVHPQLAGTPEFAQKFLFLTVIGVAALATGAAWFAGWGETSLARRVAYGLAGILATGALAALWWLVDVSLVPEGLWLSAIRQQVPPKWPGVLVLVIALAGFVAVVISLGRRGPRAAISSRSWISETSSVPRHGNRAVWLAIGLALLTTLVALLLKTALVLQLGLLAAIALIGGRLWPAASGKKDLSSSTEQATMANRFASAGVVLLVVFLASGSRLPLPVSFLCIFLAVAVGGIGIWRLGRLKLRTSLRMLAAVLTALGLGGLVATIVLRDIGSLSVWVPALFAGYFLWLLRPDEPKLYSKEKERLLAHGLLVIALGLSTLGALDLFDEIIRRLDWDLLERPRQRFLLARDTSYLLQGEWVAKVRWLASRQDMELRWVPNMNSDVAIFGVQANLGWFVAVLACLFVLAVGGCAAICGDQALRIALHIEGRRQLAMAQVLRSLGLFLWSMSVLLVAQWLVHLSTGVILHLPLTGLVFPWLSHGPTTHLLFSCALLAPMALVVALFEMALVDAPREEPLG
jgi:hypothetical protein